MLQLNVGDVLPTNEGSSITILNQEPSDAKNNYFRIKHNDEHGYVVIVTSSAIRSGSIKNPYRKSVYGIGYIGVGPYSAGTKNNKTIEYGVWSSMIRRCYDTATQTIHPTYVGCLVCEEWHNFQNFAHWYHNTGYYAMGYDLDKDLLVVGNNVYSPETCCMLPRHLNQLIRTSSTKSNGLPSGVSLHRGKYMARINTLEGSRYLGTYDTPDAAYNVYKQAKTLEVRRTAPLYADKIDSKAYVALLNWMQL